VVGSIVLGNAGNSNSSKKTHGWPPATELGSVGARDKKVEHEMRALLAIFCCVRVSTVVTRYQVHMRRNKSGPII
jgi:hypothetical protein